MVGLGRLELPTSRLSSARSNQTELQARRAVVGSQTSESGGAERNRTDDLLLAKQALSQLSYSPVSSRAPPREDGARQEGGRFVLAVERMRGRRLSRCSHKGWIGLDPKPIIRLPCLKRTPRQGLVV